MAISTGNEDQQSAVNSARESPKMAIAKAMDVVEKAQAAVVVGAELHRGQRASDEPSDEEMSSLNRAEDQDLYNLESAADAAANDVRMKRKQAGHARRHD